MHPNQRLQLEIARDFYVLFRKQLDREEVSDHPADAELEMYFYNQIIGELRMLNMTLGYR